MKVTDIGLISCLRSSIHHLSSTVRALQREVAALRDRLGQTPEPGPAPPLEPDEADDLPLFDEARREVRYQGRTWTFTNRKSRRFHFLMILFQRLGEYVSAEDVATAFYQVAQYSWPTLRRYGVRVQEDDLGVKDFPFTIRVEAEGFTLLPLF